MKAMQSRDGLKELLDAARFLATPVLCLLRVPSNLMKLFLNS
jgi:hypothetical protein